MVLKIHSSPRVAHLLEGVPVGTYTSTGYGGIPTVRHTSKLSTPIKEGGMGLYQLFWSFRMRYVSVMPMNKSGDKWQDVFLACRTNRLT